MSGGKFTRFLLVPDPPKNNCEDHWVGMPEYDNGNGVEPEITVEIKFTCQADYDQFHALLKEHLYQGERVFDGMQRAERKTSWWPLRRKEGGLVWK